MPQQAAPRPRKALQLTPELYGYLIAHGSPPDELLSRLTAETTASFRYSAGMQVPPEQGTFLTLITRLIGARRALEIGTFTGYSSICIARGLADGGLLTTCDLSADWTAVARKYWQQAKVADRIELRLGPALRTLRELPASADLDLAFIDADKAEYVSYWEEIVPRIRSGGVILADNTLAHGRVVDPVSQDDYVQGVRDFNDHAAADSRVELVLLPIGDGLTLARKK